MDTDRSHAESQPSSRRAEDDRPGLILGVERSRPRGSSKVLRGRVDEQNELHLFGRHRMPE